MKKAFVDQKLCAACGVCLKTCRMNAISIHKGMYSDIDMTKCVGCGMCEKECPANIITVKEVNSYAAKKVV